VSTEEALIRQLYVKVAGNTLETAIMNDLYRVEVESCLTLPAMCVIHVHDPGARTTNDGPFALGASLEVGVSDEQGRGETKIFEGEIIGVEPEFREGTVVDLVVRGYDRSHRLHRGAPAKTYANMSDSDIASDIAGQVGLRADVDSSSPQHEHVYQHGQTHMEFLRARAQRIGYDLYVSGESLCFKRADASNGSPLDLEWGVNLRTFRPILSLGEQVSQVEVRGWDPATKREIVGQAERGAAAPSIGESDTGGSLAETAFGQASELTVAASVASQSEADAVAQAILNEYDGAFVEAEGECYGEPELKAGGMVNITALGSRFNGRYRVTTARHVWDTARDYMTHFTVRGRRDDSVQRLLAERPTQAPQWHLMTGVVTNNSDPEDMARVKVKFPWLDGDLESQWARVVGPGAGDNRGIYWLPEVNDEVLVAFEQGDMSRPVVIGGLWNGVDAPPAGIGEVVPGGSVVQRLLVSRTGHKITFAEENPAYMQIETTGGHRITLHDDEGKIEIISQGGHTVVLDDTGRSITIKSSGQLEIEATQSLTLKAGMSMSIEAGADLTIRGAIVQLNP
jgi:phage protein D